MTIALASFLVSLGGIVVVFALKYVETTSDVVMLRRLRERVDARARRAKELLVAARADAAKLLPLAARAARYIAREGALAFAASARAAEKEARRLADLVSHKHRFERRETRSEFLRKMAEHKQEVALDTLDDNGQNI